MKRIVYIILPALFLILGAGKAIQNINSNSNKQAFNDLKIALENAKKENEQKVSEKTTEIPEINLNQKIVLQTPNTQKTETKVFKLNLPEQVNIKLVDQETLYTTDKQQTSWQWEKISGKYDYKFYVKFLPEQNAAIITSEPIERKEIQLPFASIIFEQEDNTIYCNGNSYGMTSHSFHRPIFVIK